MVVISMVLHVVIIGSFSIQYKKNARKIDLPYYSVNLIGDMGSRAGTPRAATVPEKKETAPARQVEPAIPKPVRQPKEKEISIAPKQKEKTREKPVEPKKEATKASSDDVRNLSDRIRQLKKKTQYIDMAGRGADEGVGPGTGLAGGGTVANQKFARYIDEVREKIFEVWKIPSSVRARNMQANVTIKIREDGRITGWTIDEGSGNKFYDESINRALRVLGSLPPPPEPYGEIPLSFRPMN
jgi:colicin import membrane protein